MEEEKREGGKGAETKNELLKDTEATFSVLNTNKGKLSQETVNIIGASGKVEKQIFCNSINFKFVGG